MHGAGLPPSQSTPALNVELPVATLLAPADGATVGSMGPLLRWTNPAGTLGYHLQVLPYNDDGPGIDLVRSGGDSSFQVPPPPQWYGLLPDMTYTWRLRTALGLPGLGELWGPWSERTFRTPAAGSEGIALSNTADSSTPTLHWSNSRPDIFYYEVELSSDASFNKDPLTATAAVYQALLHGGVTGNSYRVPDNSPLQEGTTYHWRVRPRVQGDGRPVAWTRSSSFTTHGTTSAAAAAPDSSLEQASLDLINQVREEHGLVRLSVAGELTESARLHSEDMAAQNSMSHTGSDGSGPGERIARVGYDWRVFGEIVAAGYSTPAAVVDAWMNSPAHREVILLSSLREFGGGLVYSSAGRPYWTVNFGARLKILPPFMGGS